MTPRPVTPKTVSVLVRIPKSGSTTLRRMMVAAYPQARLFTVPETGATAAGRVTPYEAFRNRRRRLKHFLGYGAVSEAGMWRRIARDVGDGDIVTGHLRYGEPAIPDADLRYITLLRDPAARILSNYNYDRLGFQKRSPARQRYLTGQLQAAGRSFLDYLHYMADAERRSVLPAVAYVTGDETPADPFDFLRERYFHWGVLERLDLFAAGLGEKTGREVAPEWGNRTPERERTELTTEERRLIERVFAQDIELYEKARDAVLAGA